MPRQWSFHPTDETTVRSLSSRLRVSPLLAQVLVGRGFSDPGQAERFLNPRLTDLHDPDLLPGVSAAADVVVAAVRAGRRITIYGDYDVDGVTATSLLWHCLTLCGGTVDYYIPSRLEEGYGLNEAALRELHEEDPKRLVITVDCGISSTDHAAVARELGLDLIITDHHQIGDELPNAVALVHPRLPGTDYPFGELCGAGVALKLAWAVCKRLGDGKKASPALREYLKQAVGLAAVGTVADVVPLLDENRAIVRYGLMTLREQSTPGLQSLLGVAGLRDRDELKSDDIGFGIGPRINAAGRLGQARLAVELLTTEDRARATVLAEYLNQLNDNRKTVERRILKQARELVEANPEWLEHGALVLAHHDWHPGVIGIVASRVAEEFEKPAIMIALREDGTGQGSGRSYAGLDLYAALSATSEHLLTFGGHRAAAGLRVAASSLDTFRRALADWTADNFHPTARDTELQLDAEVLLSEVNWRAVRELDRLGPCGQSNPSPRFAASGITLAEAPRTMGEGGRHLSIRVRQHGTTLRAIAFGRGEWAEELAQLTRPFQISFVPVNSEFRGVSRTELQLVDWKPAADEPQTG